MGTDPDQAMLPWLAAALSRPSTKRHVDVEGARIRYLSWGEGDLPPVLLVHGGMAHARWWDHVAPMLEGRRVVAIDLSGHGGSGSRPENNVLQWAREVTAVVIDAQLTQPILVAHSMGGQVAVAAAVHAPDLVRGVITIDTRFNDYQSATRTKPSERFATVDEAVKVFEETHHHPDLGTDPALLRHVAEASLVSADGMWRWSRPDEYRISFASLRELISELTRPLAIIRTERGLVTEAMAHEMLTIVGGPAAVVSIPSAAHNPMFEQPVALITALRTLLDVWPPFRSAAHNTRNRSEEV